MNKFYASAKISSPIAIIGMGMRFPASVRTEAEMWSTLAGGRSNISKIPDTRWPVEELSHPERGEPGRSVNFRAGVLEGVDEFDAAFFGISPREAAWMDPQQRLLLEMAHDAMEDAGLPPNRLQGSSCGVYIGISGMDYGQNALEDLASMSPWTMTGNTLSIAANRLSWIYDLRGPSLAIDTACSSSLAAIHQACQAIRNGEIPLALAGGVNVLMHPYAFIGFSLASMLSAKGECRPFDAAASGYVRGEGGALFLLKPLDRALEDGDRIHAVIMGTGINSDGSRKTGLTIPSADAQAELMASVLDQSGLVPDDIDFVEAHGTGTPVGDPVEAKSIGLAYGRRRKNPLPISSAKANFGHLEPASGMAGMVRAILALKHGQIPPMPFEYVQNPAIPFDNLNIFCAAGGYKLDPRNGRPFVCAVNSFGFGGLNAHALLASAPAIANAVSHCSVPLPPLFLSARTDKALRALAGLYADELEAKGSEAYAEIAANAALGRDWLERRLAIFGQSPEEMASALRAYAAGENPGQISVSSAMPEAGGIAFIYSGNGSQWAGMGRQLLEESPEFRAAVERLDEAMLPVLGWSVMAAMLEADAAFMEDTAHAQPLLFAVQVALTIVLADMGIKPQATAGHSVGEIAAAWAAGQLDLSEAIRVVHARSVVQGHTRGMGKMAAIGLGQEEASQIIAAEGFSDELEIAAANSMSNSTISGSEEALDKLGKILSEKGIFFRKLELDYAFHSRAMDTEAEALARLLNGLEPHGEEETLFVSTVTAEPMRGGSLDSHYWWRNMRERVAFSSAIKTLYAQGMRVFVEIGPHAVLQRYIRENLSDNAANCRIMPLLQRGNAGFDRIRQIAATLYLLSGQESIIKIFPSSWRRLALPFYPWQKERHIFSHTSEQHPRPDRKWDLLGWPLPGPVPLWENILDPRKDSWLEDHKVGGTTVLAAAAWLEIALEAGRSWLKGTGIGIENLSISLPLVFEKGQAQTIRTVINSADGAFRILSRPRLESGDWLEHARGRIVALSATGSTAPAAIVQGKSIDAEALYSHTAAMGLEYGPFFRRVQSLNFNENELSGTLPEGEADKFVLDPGAIDACFHSLAVFYDKAGTAFLPVGARSVAVLSSAGIRSFRGKLRKISRRTIRADFQLLAANGEVVAALENCIFRKIPEPVTKSRIAWWHTLAQFTPLPRNAAPAQLARAGEFLRELLSGKSENAERKFWHQEIFQNFEAMAAAGIFGVIKEVQGRKNAQSALSAWLDTLWAQNVDMPAGEVPHWRAIWEDLRKAAPQWLPVFLPLGRLLDTLDEKNSLMVPDLLDLLRENPDSLSRTPRHPLWHGTEQIIKDLLAGLAHALPPQYGLRIFDYGAWPSLYVEDMEGLLNSGRVSLQLAEALPDEDKSGQPADVIVVRDLLHKAENVRGMLARIYARMQPGGLLLIEERHPDWSAVLLEGLDENWWKRDGDGKQLPARMWPSDWQKLLEACGFENIIISQEPEAEGLPQGAFLVSASRPRKSAGPEAGQESASWLLLSERGAESLAGALRRRLEERGQTVFVDVLAEKSLQPADNIVFITGASSPDPADTLEKIGLIAAAAPASCWLVTQGASLLPDLPDSYASGPMQAMLTGFARVFNSESAAAPLNYVDVDAGLEEEQKVFLLTEEFLANVSHEEITWTAQGRFQPRLAPLPQKEKILVERYRLDVSQPGKIDNISWHPLEDSAPGPDQLEARVHATGLNFRDIMLALGLLPEDALENGFAGAAPGLEFAGVVTRVGNRVKDFKPGDRIVGFAPASFASHVLSPAKACARIPETMPFHIAAALPTIYVTAWYALHYLGHIAPGETVLIHGGAGGVGLAAIQIAKQAGAKVFATAGSPEKRDLLRLLGVELVADSRSLSFADQIMQATNGQGVDLVLNSLAGEAMRRSLGLLKPFGRFLELGKRDYVENTSVGLAPFKENISYFSIDVDQLLSGRPELAGRLFTEIMEFLNSGSFLPPPVHVFPARKIVSAFRAMQHSRQIGKIVVDMAALHPGSSPNLSPGITDKTGTWLVTGALSGFGLATARHLAELGIKNLVLVSRQGQASKNYQEIQAFFSARNVNLLVESCDVTNMEEVEKLVRKISSAMPDLKGVVHAAAIFEDRQLKDMDAAAYEHVYKPKLQGALNLDAATRHLPLKYFVLYSSISVAIGNPGQANYVAANAGLESLARERIRCNLPASCIAWGPIGDCGYLGRNPKVRLILENHMGARAMTTAEAMEQFDHFAGKNGIHIVSNLDWHKIGLSLSDPPSRYAQLADAGAGENPVRGDWLEKIRAMSREQALGQIQECVVSETVKVLGLSAADIPAGKSLAALGLDSLMAMELATGIEQMTGLRLPPMLMQDAPSIAQLAERLYERIMGGVQEEAGADAMLAELARRHAESLAPEESRAVLESLKEV